MTSIVVGTAGHIDHGKSALVRALTGSDPDRLKEEKARGITIDLGFAHCQLGDLTVAFVDVPGHERFVKNMLAGACGIDCVLLVVAADESVMPQTREHFDICRLLRVPSGLVALTKGDLVDDETVELVRMETTELVEGSFLEGAPIVPVSAKTGAGLGELRQALSEVAARLRARPSTGIARLPVDRAFTVKGFGTVVTGTLVSGQITPDMELEVLPSGRRVKVRGLQVHGERQDRARSAQRVAVNLAGIDVDELTRGDVLVPPGGLEVTRRLDALVSLLPSARELRHGARVRFHTGTSEVMARVSLAGSADAAIDETSPRALEPGRDAYARLRLEQDVALTRDDAYVLRAYSPPVTIAGGRVLDPSPGRGRLRSPAGLRRLRRLDTATTDLEYVVAMVDEAGIRGLPRSRLTPRAGVAPEAIADVVTSLTSDGRAVDVGMRLLAPDRVRQSREQLAGWVSEFHAQHPLEPGLPREEARERFSRRSSSDVFDGIVETLVSDGTLTARDHLAVASHRILLSVEETRVKNQVAERLRQAGLSPPDAAAVVAETGAPAEVVDRMVKLLCREDVLVRVESLVFHADELARLKQEVAAFKTDAAGTERVEVDVARFKQRFGVTRKYAIPLLGYLDRERVTRRVGNVRVVL